MKVTEKLLSRLPAIDTAISANRSEAFIDIQGQIIYFDWYPRKVERVESRGAIQLCCLCNCQARHNTRPWYMHDTVYYMIAQGTTSLSLGIILS